MKLNHLILLVSLISIISATTECTFNVDPEPPASPSDIVVTPSDSKVEIVWNFNNEPDFEGYNLYKSDQAIGDIQELTPVNESVFTDTTFVDEEVANGTTYYYRITSVDLNGNESSPSRQIQVTPFAPPPSRP
ncbi:hypothetical protein [Gracilimonas sp.]|uniref:hypothetical protein n=1 Tax=Gracilimonas sp. TaxID=1974203 RepID=UPI002870C8C9|nr:fibronectin type III domain-containing protein [Gracilimonas sp.]